jgi:hypothetical protein
MMRSDENYYSIGGDVKNIAVMAQKPGKFVPGMSNAQSLFHYSFQMEKLGVKAHFLEFGTLQRMNIVDLQNKLAIIKGNVWKDMSAPDEIMKELRETLKDYGIAHFIN